MEREVDQQISGAPAVKCPLYGSVVVKEEQSWKSSQFSDLLTFQLKATQQAFSSDRKNDTGGQNEFSL